LNLTRRIANKKPPPDLTEAFFLEGVSDNDYVAVWIFFDGADIPGRAVLLSHLAQKNFAKKISFVQLKTI